MSAILAPEQERLKQGASQQAAGSSVCVCVSRKTRGGNDLAWGETLLQTQGAGCCVELQSGAFPLLGLLSELILGGPEDRLETCHMLA